MPQQLRDRLNTVFTDAPWQRISGVAGHYVGRRIRDVRAMVVHQTAGWPPRQNGTGMFDTHFLPSGLNDGITTQLYVAGDGTVMQGMELPRKTHHARGVNDWSIGSETGHGLGNYKSNAHVGPYTSTDRRMVPNPNPPPPPLIMHGGLIPPARMNGTPPNPNTRWLPLSGDDTIEDIRDDDVPGAKFWLRHHGFNDLAVSLWTTARYNGPWRQPQRVPECLFSEAQYRSWALLARYIAEQYLLPRNFPVLPHKLRDGGFGETGNHGMLRDAASFATIVLADEKLSRSPAAFGTPALAMPLTSAALQTRYTAGLPAGADLNPRWTNVFDQYRGFHGHGFCGDSVQRHDHDCPGAMFDWHRFAREVWDWWWWPFDFDTANANNPVAERPYSLPTRDGNTPLKEYYWATPVATPQGRGRQGIHGTRSSPQTFELPQRSRLYALANGELVAARFPAETDAVSLAFVLVRHEVFHQLDTRPAAPNATPPVFANRIDYDVAPTTVYSLYMHLGRPPGMSFDRVVPENPDWLNRVLIRKKECELGIAFRASAAANPITAAQWNNVPPAAPGAPARPSLGAGWTADNNALTPFLAALGAGNLALAPLDPNTTPIRILLGDYLAHAGVIGRSGTTTRRGVRVELFSSALISTDFTLTDTTASGGGWAPPAGTGPPAVRYASEWARTPAGPELTALQTAGVTTPALVNWWGDVQPATLNARLPADAHLDEHGVAIHYDLLTFMPWLNQRTWRSEWPKYRATDPAGIPAAPRPR